MHFLYLKTHNKTGLKYLGYTTQDPHTYRGSGLHWTAHLKVHGDDVSTTVLLETTDKSKVKSQGKYFSQLWDVVTSKDFANITVEQGQGGPIAGSGRKHGYKAGPEERRKISVGVSGENNGMYGKTGEQNPFFGKTHAEETVETIRTAAQNRAPDSAETRYKKGSAHRGRSLSATHRENQSKGMRGLPRCSCLTCGTTVASHHLNRHMRKHIQ